MYKEPDVSENLLYRTAKIYLTREVRISSINLHNSHAF